MSRLDWITRADNSPIHLLFLWFRACVCVCVCVSVFLFSICCLSSSPRRVLVFNESDVEREQNDELGFHLPWAQLWWLSVSFTVHNWFRFKCQHWTRVTLMQVHSMFWHSRNCFHVPVWYGVDFFGSMCSYLESLRVFLRLYAFWRRFPNSCRLQLAAAGFSSGLTLSERTELGYLGRRLSIEMLLKKDLLRWWFSINLHRQPSLISAEQFLGMNRIWLSTDFFLQAIGFFVSVEFLGYGRNFCGTKKNRESPDGSWKWKRNIIATLFHRTERVVPVERYRADKGRVIFGDDQSIRTANRSRGGAAAKRKQKKKEKKNGRRPSVGAGVGPLTRFLSTNDRPRSGPDEIPHPLSERLSY